MDSFTGGGADPEGTTAGTTEGATGATGLTPQGPTW